MDTIKIELPYLPPASFSPNARCHWAVRNRDNEMVKNNVFFLLREQFATIPKLQRISLHYTIVVPDKRRRDYDNFIARCKPITDALVYAGLIADDTPQYIKDFRLTFEIVKGKKATIIEIKEVEDETE
jgi:Holliday junction resolvase RusA-like endonuclease